MNKKKQADFDPLPMMVGSFLVIMFTVFFGLKVSGAIDVPWWVVTLPLWGTPALIAGLFLLGTIFIVWQQRKLRKINRGFGLD